MNNLIDKPAIFSGKLQKWYILNRRDLPWRNTIDPYKIWLSEIILQQTRVAQGLAYYNKFAKHYPTINDLAEANEQSILKDWQGLGYYSRARNMYHAAKTIQKEHQGIFPTEYKAIRDLKGIGDYTAAAIASFAYEQAHAVIDGNVYRLLSRLFGIDTPIDSNEGKKQFQLIADQLLDKNNAGTHNQAIMEFGALQCTPKNPDCQQCVFNTDCIAYKNKKQHLFPVKSKKTKQRKRFFNYLILEVEDEILLNKRTEKEIWQNLHDFPLIETEKKVDKQEVLQQNTFKSLLDSSNYKLTAVSSERKHILSHQIILATFFHFRLNNKPTAKTKNFQWVKKSELVQYPIPKLIENYLMEETNFLSLFD